MRVPKFRLRTLMIAVAVLGIAFGSLAGLLRMGQRTQRFRQWRGSTDSGR